jgi:hypothetical protein
MDDPFLQKVVVSGQNLLHYLYGHALSDFFFLADVIHEISVGAVLQDNVVMVRSFNDFMALHDVLMAQGFVNLYFALKHTQIGASEFF